MAKFQKFRIQTLDEQLINIYFVTKELHNYLIHNKRRTDYIMHIDTYFLLS